MAKSFSTYTFTSTELSVFFDDELQLTATTKCLESGKGSPKNLIPRSALISSTMSLGDQFQVTLPSNVKVNEKNKAGQYEITLATPLDVSGDWEVALIDTTYPHIWINLNKEYHMAVKTFFNEDENNQKQNILGDAKPARLIS